MEQAEIRNEARSAVTLSLLLDHDSQKENSSHDPSNGKKSLFAITSVTQGNALSSGANENVNDMQQDNQTCTNPSSRCSSPDGDDEDTGDQFNKGRWIVFNGKINRQTCNPPVALDADSDQYKIEPSWLINCVHPDPNSNRAPIANNSSNIHSKLVNRHSHSSDHRFTDSHRPEEVFSPDSNNFQWNHDQGSVPKCSGLDDCGEDDHVRGAGTSPRTYRHHRFRCHDSCCKIPPTHSILRPPCQMHTCNCIHRGNDEYLYQRECAYHHYKGECFCFRNAANFGSRPHPNHRSYNNNSYHCDTFCFAAQNIHSNAYEFCRCNYIAEVIDPLITRVEDILILTSNLTKKLTKVSDEDISVPRSYISFLLHENKLLEREISMYKHQISTNNYQPQRFPHRQNHHSPPLHCTCAGEKLNFINRQNQRNQSFHPCDTRREHQQFNESYRNRCYYDDLHDPPHSFHPPHSNKSSMARNQDSFHDKDSPVIDGSCRVNYPKQSSGLAPASSQNHNFPHQSSTEVPRDNCRNINSNCLESLASSHHQNLQNLQDKTDLLDENYVGRNPDMNSQSSINENKDCDETQWNLSQRNASISLNQIDSGLSMISNHIPESSAIVDYSTSQNSSLMSSAKSSEVSRRPPLGSERRGRFELRRFS